MKGTSKILWITRTAVFLALLVVLQGVTKPMGQYVTGTVVNLTLILAVMLGGLCSGIVVAALSPILAFLVGIGPALAPLLPFIMLGNIVLVVVWHIIAGNASANKLIAKSAVALVAGAVCKFLALYLGIVQLALPVILQLPEKQAAVISASFSFPQIITAALGGMVALLVLPVLRKALAKKAA